MAVAARRERERTARREAILDAAQDLIAAEGYHGMRMDGVAEAARLQQGHAVPLLREQEHAFAPRSQLGFSTRCCLSSRPRWKRPPRAWTLSKGCSVNTTSSLRITTTTFDSRSNG